LLLLLARTAAAADDLVALGVAVAVENCARCHAVGSVDESLEARAPPFIALGADYPILMLVEALRTGVVRGHGAMPQLNLGLDAAKALVAYIDSLNPTALPHLGKRP
jgi:mono/diheme cytochrome c family protein